MKKLMVAAAAALTATIGFSVESSNIVGYQTTTLKNASGYNFIAPTFVDVGGATYNLANVKLIGEYVGDGASDWIEVWDETGNMTSTSYFYATEAGGYEKDGWLTEMMGSTYVDDVALPAGQGLYLVANSGDVSVQYSGAVKVGTITVSTVSGYNIIGNATPIPVNLANVKLIGEYVGDGASDWIEVWDETGNMTSTSYFYASEAGGYEKDGWLTEMMGSTYVDDVVYQPGEGFFLVANSGDVQVQMPAALAE